jgi:hypothetical protein
LVRFKITNKEDAGNEKNAESRAMKKNEEVYLSRDDEAQNGRTKENKRNHNSRVMQNFIHAAFGGVNIAGAAKDTAQARPLLLEQNNNNKKTGGTKLQEGNDGFFHKKRVEISIP